MSQTGPLVRNISDTALWVAVYRARETDRPDAVFRDPFARRLAGERGEQIALSMPWASSVGWFWAASVYLVDSFISERVGQGTDLVINLAAGLDTRPYRMALPASLRWIEVDLPDILAYKEEILRGEKPVCSVERVPLDLSDRTARRHLLEKLCKGASSALVLTEGLILYLSPEEVGALAQDLAAVPRLRHWVFDLQSPAAIRMAQKSLNTALAASGTSIRFGPDEGPFFFEGYGWTPVDVRSHLKTAARLKRLPFRFRLLALLPEPKGRMGSRPWWGICLMKKQ